MNDEQFEEWFIFIDGATALMGRVVDVDEESRHVSPVYRLEGAMNVIGHADRPGRVDVQRPVRVSPVLGLVSLRELDVPLSMPRVKIGSLSSADRRKLLKALEICDDVVQSLRAEDAGVSLVTRQ